MRPLAIIRPGITRGPWVLCTSDGGAVLWSSPSWSRTVEVARTLIDTLTWDHEIDAMEAPC